MKRMRILCLGLICTLLVAQVSAGKVSGNSTPAHITLLSASEDRPTPSAAEAIALSSPQALGLIGEVDSITGSVGHDVIVRIRDEAGAERVGAKVYHNGNYVGLTGEGGTATIEKVRIGDELAALSQVYEQASPKGDHDLDSTTDWAWRIYHTNVHIADDGTPQLFEVTDTTVIQELTVRRDQPLVGFHLVVCVEWDADSSYMADLRQGLEKASDLLYDIGDGQFIWEVIEVFDNRSDWGNCDMAILASNQEWPMGNIWGITYGQSKHITLGRHFNGRSPDSGNWAVEDGFRTMVHEFGYYGLGLWDEYPKDQGLGGAPQTAHLYPATGDTCDSIMNNPYSASALCPRADPNYQKGFQTQHYARTKGELTWETVLRHFGDSASPARWTLKSPVERGAIVPGPDRIPVADWMQVHMTDHNTGACPTFGIQATYTDSGAPMGEAEAWIAPPSLSLPDLPQGKTDEAGRIAIYGAHSGDRIRVNNSTSPATITVSCSETLVWTQETTASASGSAQ